MSEILLISLGNAALSAWSASVVAVFGAILVGHLRGAKLPFGALCASTLGSIAGGSVLSLSVRAMLFM